MDRLLSRGHKEVSEEKAARFDESVGKDLLTHLSLPNYLRTEFRFTDGIEKSPAGVDELITRNGMTSLPWHVIPRRVAEFDFLDLWRRPTKCPVLSAFSDCLDISDGRPVVMVFRAVRYGKLVITTLDSFRPDGGYAVIVTPKVGGIPAAAVVRFVDWLEAAREWYSPYP